MRTTEMCARQRSRASPDASARIDALLGFLFGSAAAATVWSCRSMAAMGETPMPGGWSMSSVWAPMCGQTWLSAAAAFAEMWTLMMVAMMLPSSTPQWRRCWRGCQKRSQGSPAWLALCAGACYLLAWALAGMLLFCAGNALATTLERASMLARAVPSSSGVAIAIAGALRFTRWKRQRTASCKSSRSPDLEPTRTIAGACRFGLRLALHEGYCCAGLMAVALGIGIMDWMAMAAVMAAATLERVKPLNGRTTRAIGAVIAATGLLLVARSVVPALR
jgi:predicted metal-binding membrane protein